MKAKSGRICPVCGKYQFEEDDNFEICPVCGWEDDAIQREAPDYDGGANPISLNQAIEAYKNNKSSKNTSFQGRFEND